MMIKIVTIILGVNIQIFHFHKVRCLWCNTFKFFAVLKQSQKLKLFICFTFHGIFVANKQDEFYIAA